MSRLATVLCLAALIVPGSLHAQDTTKQVKLKRNPDLISSQEIEATSGDVRTAYDLVKMLRPIWLQARGASSIRSQTPDPQVYVGGVHRGGSARLEDIPRSSVREIQHLRGTDATQRYGMGHESGAILVTLK
jgi:hypothetical protein